MAQSPPSTWMEYEKRWREVLCPSNPAAQAIRPSAEASKKPSNFDGLRRQLINELMSDDISKKPTILESQRLQSLKELNLYLESPRDNFTDEMVLHFNDTNDLVDVTHNLADDTAISHYIRKSRIGFPRLEIEEADVSSYNIPKIVEELENVTGEHMDQTSAFYWGYSHDSRGPLERPQESITERRFKNPVVQVFTDFKNYDVAVTVEATMIGNSKDGRNGGKCKNKRRAKRSDELSDKDTHSFPNGKYTGNVYFIYEQYV